MNKLQIFLQNSHKSVLFTKKSVVFLNLNLNQRKIFRKYWFVVIRKQTVHFKIKYWCSFLARTRNEPKKPLQGRLQKYNLYKVRFKRPEIRQSEFPKWNFNCLAPRNPLRRPHFKGANGIKVISILTPLRQKSAAKAVCFHFDWCNKSY